MDQKLCKRCKKPNDQNDKATCDVCRAKQQSYMAARRVVLKEDSVCQQCCVSQAKKDSIYCQSCLDKQKTSREARATAGICVYCRKPSTTGKTCNDCKTRSRINAAAKRQIWKEQSKCVKCGGERDSKLSKCIACRKLATESYIRSQKRYEDLGVCIDCGSASATPGNRRCVACYLKRVAGKRLGNAFRWQEIELLFDQQSGICPYSGLKLEIGIDADLDHKTPVSKGGSNEIENLQWVHSMANTMKWHYSEEEFLNMVCLIAARRQ